MKKLICCVLVTCAIIVGACSTAEDMGKSRIDRLERLEQINGLK